MNEGYDIALIHLRSLEFTENIQPVKIEQVQPISNIDIIALGSGITSGFNSLEFGYPQFIRWVRGTTYTKDLLDRQQLGDGHPIKYEDHLCFETKHGKKLQ